MKELGFNYRITDFQCALGTSQLRKINKFTKGRKSIALFYDKNFKNFKNVEYPRIPPKFESAYHLYPLKINFKKTKLQKNVFFKKLLKRGIKLQVHDIPINTHTYYKKKYTLSFKNFPKTEKFYNNVVSIPIYCNLKKSILRKIVKSIKKLLN